MKLTILLAAAWVAWCLPRLRGPAGEWLAVLPRLGDVPWLDLVTPGLLLAPARLALLAVLGAAFVLGVVGAGRAILRIWVLPGAGSGERLAVEVLAGFAGMAAWFFGLGLAGLFHPVLLVGSFAAVLALPGGVTAVRDLLAALRSLKPGPEWLVLGPVALAGVAMLGPDTHVDTYTYHLAAPDLFLRVHRFVGADLPVQAPLSAELLYALGVVAEYDAAPHFIQLVPFLAAVGLLAAWAGRAAGPVAAWATVALVLTMGEVGLQMVLAKNNLATAAYPVAAVVCGIRGLGRRSPAWLILSAALFGAGAAHKWSAYPLLALGWAGTELALRTEGRGSWRVSLAWLAAAAAPLAPWLLKTWLFTGDPLWPFLARWLPGVLWYPESGKAMALLRSGETAVDVLLRMGPRWVELWLRNQPVVVLLLPLALAGSWSWGKEARRMLGYSAAAYVGLSFLMAHYAGRLALPALVLWTGGLSVGVAELARRWPARAWRGAVVAAAVLMWLPLGEAFRGFVNVPALAGYLAGQLDQRENLARRLTTYGELGELLQQLKVTGKVMNIGDKRSYRLPCRVLLTRSPGVNWAWRLARECRTSAAIRKRMRQAGCRHFTYNFVNEQFARGYSVAFPWDERMLAVWVEFVGRHLEVAGWTPHVDQSNGGYCVFRLRDRPLRRDPAFLHYLPGILDLYHEIGRRGAAEGWDGALAAALKLHRRLPQVNYIRDLVGVLYTSRGRWDQVHAFHASSAKHGTIGDLNLANAGVAAIRLRKWDEAVRLLSRAIAIFPHWRNEGRMHLAFCLALAKGGARLPEAVELARELVREDPENAEYLYTLGFTLTVAQERGEAEAVLGKALERVAEVPDERKREVARARILKVLGKLRESSGVPVRL